MSADQMISCDIFCAVIDNLGDSGVCWRLARQLATEHGWQVRLWIDDPAPLDLLAPDHARLPVEIRAWAGDFATVTPARIVIEAFACELPAAYLATMATQAHPPVWINLEYLSAEDWVAGCHGLPSPHPQLPLPKYFFFPGFTSGTGGLLRERNFAVPHAGHFIPPAPTFGASLNVSLFCYDNPALPDLLDSWRDGKQPINCQVAAGLPQRQVEAWLKQAFPTGSAIRHGQLTLHALPFLPQTDYDDLLARCQLNFVRGEDSLVRALWAERPFVWQAYPQAENAHHAKLSALLELLSADEPLKNLCWAWNTAGAIASAWPPLLAALPRLAEQAPQQARKIAAPGDLAGNLAKFCNEICAARL